MLHEPVQPPSGYVVFDEAKMGWPEIDPTLMEDGRGVVPEFPITVLSPEWSRWVCDTAEAGGTPVDYVAQSLLAAISALCSAGVMARVSAAWAEPLGCGRRWSAGRRAASRRRWRRRATCWARSRT